MPFSIEYKNLPAGYAMTKTRRGEKISVAVREFVSTEDGDLFIERLEGLPQQVIAMLPEPAKIRPSIIDSMLVLINPDKSANVYINELDVIIKTRLKKSISRGDKVFLDDIATIESLEFNKVKLPASSGLFYIFSIGWRKGMYYDLAPLHGEKHPRDYDLSALLAYYYTYLSYQHLFKITEDIWQSLFDNKWFPFASLSVGFKKKLVSHVRSGWDLSELLEEANVEVLSMLGSIRDRWNSSLLFEPRMEMIGHALNEYREGDYISSTSVLYPQIEGILRVAQSHLTDETHINYSTLLDTTVGDPEASLDQRSLLLPRMFRKYMEDVYLANFEPGIPAELSRHSLAHGVADPSKYDQMGAMQGILILDQLYFFLPYSPIIGDTQSDLDVSI